jgi:hypothetical protein
MVTNADEHDRLKENNPELLDAYLALFRLSEED